MSNIRYANMCHWKVVPYAQVPNFRDFYYEDNTNSVYYADWDKLLKYQKALGFDGIEIAPWDLADLTPLFGSPEAFRDFAAARGVEVTGMFHGAHACHVKEKFDEVVQAGKDAVDTIVKFGGTQMNTCPTDNYHGIGPLNEEQLANCARAINAIGDYAISKGVKVGLHNEFFCGINLNEHRRFIEMTNPESVFYCIDTAQISLMGEDLLDFYDTYADRISGFHLKDTVDPGLPDEVRFSKDPEIQDDGKRWFWEPGEGVLDFKGLYALLKKHQYKGWMTLETDGSPDYLASMALSRYYIDTVLKPIYD